MNCIPCGAPVEQDAGFCTLCGSPTYRGLQRRREHTLLAWCFWVNLVTLVLVSFGGLLSLALYLVPTEISPSISASSLVKSGIGLLGLGILTALSGILLFRRPRGTGNSMLCAGLSGLYAAFQLHEFFITLFFLSDRVGKADVVSSWSFVVSKGLDLLVSLIVCAAFVILCLRFAGKRVKAAYTGMRALLWTGIALIVFSDLLAMQGAKASFSFNNHSALNWLLLNLVCVLLMAGSVLPLAAFLGVYRGMTEKSE